MNLSGLDGKVAVITGAAGSIGGATVRRFAAEGVQVAGVDVNGAGLAQLRKQLDLKIYQADLSTSAVVASLTRQVLADFGQVDFLLNIAGGEATERPGFKPIEDLDDDMWTATLSSNLTSAFLCCRAFVPHMRERRTGRIINFASFATRHGSNRVGVHYAAAKGGIVGLTKTLALELAPFGIAVNALAPGDIPGGRLAEIRGQLFTPDQEQALLRKIPLGRVGTPEEVASVLAVLCSDAGAYVTGLTLDVNGGLYIGP